MAIPTSMKLFEGSAMPMADRVKTEHPIVPSIETDDTSIDSGCSCDSGADAENEAKAEGRSNTPPPALPSIRRVDTLENIIWRKCCRQVLSAHIGMNDPDYAPCHECVEYPSDVFSRSQPDQSAGRCQYRGTADHGCGGVQVAVSSLLCTLVSTTDRSTGHQNLSGAGLCGRPCLQGGGP